MNRLSIAALAVTSGAASAFAPPSTASSPSTATRQPATSVLEASSLAVDGNSRPLYDPLGLYPENSKERLEKRISPLEQSVADTAKPIIDPLNLYNNKDAIDSTADMSQALPFATRPQYLDGSMAGDAGFDPLGLAANPDRLNFMREAELKHARIAMLAAAGWPIAELLHTKLAFMLHAKPLLQFGERVPSVLNGGLGNVFSDYWPYLTAALALGGGIEIVQEYKKRSAAAQGEDEGWVVASGNFGFDPLNIYNSKNEDGKRALELSEIKHGRLAMMAITFFAMQEAFTGSGIVSNILAFLNPQSADFLADNVPANIGAILSRAA